MYTVAPVPTRYLERLIDFIVTKNYDFSVKEE
jgi:hypothetical protein